MPSPYLNIQVTQYSKPGEFTACYAIDGISMTLPLLTEVGPLILVVLPISRINLLSFYDARIRLSINHHIEFHLFYL